MEMASEPETRAQPADLPVVYRDRYLIAVHKPAGLLVHRSPVSSRDRVFAVQTVRNQIGRHVYPVHRLDKPTSGLLLFALSSETAGKTMRLFESGRVEKRYLAVVRGTVPEEGCVDHALKKVRDRFFRQSGNGASPAITDYRRLGTVEVPERVDRYPTSRYSLVALWPRTGRRHQLRRHMRHIAHPIIGDTKYGQRTHNQYFRDRFACHRLLLAAVEMRLPHPETGETLRLRAGVDGVFARVLAAFSWQGFAGDRTV